ncbi:hypothetical protein NLX83_40220 [Allokutzneria sp. A3M-2-11 16]|uniref:WXG100 family type VII secretion target n=1 Tax=Allokutzneria sp. A3M-2-11 16 TaxID=2962043 RepID=UPI0020B6E577|nr:hypothetical protein [Allokutzneria sp. A3M-2-11 16]MCP3805510.1 hypothetical protein [Allokutzneria sp. A3M-2-11 16]
MGKPGDQNSEYYGYDVNQLDQQSNGTEGGQHSGATPAWSKYYTESWEHANPRGQEQQPPRETPAADKSDADIEAIKLQIMGEQPGTAEERAFQWRALAAMLDSVQTQVRTQTDQLDGDWESPFAKESFLSKIGKSLAFLEVWRRGAAENSEALDGLAKTMRNYQDRMTTLWNEFKPKYDGASASLGDHIVGFFSLSTASKENAKAKQEVRDEYSVKARKLLSEMAGEYQPYLGKLASGRAKMLAPQNAVFHPGALGMPTPTLPGVPGGAPGGPPGGPGAFKGSTPPLAAPSDLGDQLRQFQQPPPTPTPGPLPTLTAPTPTMTPPPLPTTAPPPVLPGSLRTAGAPPAPGQLNAPNAANALNRGLGVLGGTPPAANAHAPGAFKGAAPPGFGGSTLGANSLGNPMTPPPAPQNGGKAAPRKQDRKDVPGLGGPQAPGQMTPPPAPQNGERKRPGAPGQPGTPLNPNVDNAFQAPPSSAAPSVLGGDKPVPAKHYRPGTAPSKPNPAGDFVPPPVLANPHRTGPAKTHTEDLAARERALREQRRLDEQRGRNSEFAVGQPTGTSPVLEGRSAPKKATDAKREKEAAVPSALVGATGPAVLDRHAEQRSADQRARDIRRQVEHSTEEAWAPQEGAAVLDRRDEQEYRAEPKPTVGGTR